MTGEGQAASAAEEMGQAREEIAVAEHLLDAGLPRVHFVRPGRFDPPVSRLLGCLQKFREEADYAEAFVIDVVGAREELEASRGLVETISRGL